MKISYDFHIHTDASPCGDDYMTPGNIIHMAKLLNKQIIAVTDHNTCINCEAVMKMGEKEGILVIPGMEVECMEEFHLIVLFPDLQKARKFQKYIEGHMLKITNKPHIFGHQHVLNEDGEVIDEIEYLLLTAVQQSVYELYQKVITLGGIMYPAHIDRNSYSIISNLGMVPEDVPFKLLEVSQEGDIDFYKGLYPNYYILQSSDAHYLKDMCHKEQFIELPMSDISSLFNYLMKYFIKI